MTTYYTLKDGSKVSVFFWDDYYTDKELFHVIACLNEWDKDYNVKKALCIKYPDEGPVPVEHRVKVREDDSKRKFIVWKGETIYLEDWDYFNLPDLLIQLDLDKHEKNYALWYRDLLLCSLMKQSNNFGIKMRSAIYDIIMPELGIGLTSDKMTEKPIEFIPELCPLREVRDWHYKIRFQPKDEFMRLRCPSKEFYIDDFCRCVYDGRIELFIRGLEIDKT